MSNRSVAILGGGISGLSVAHYLLKNANKSGINITKLFLIEEQASFGGYLQTARIGNSNDYYELGPRTISTNSYAGTNAIALVDQIGLAESVKYVSKKSKSFGKRFVVIDGKLFGLPTGLMDLFSYRKPFKPFISYLIKDLRTPRILLPPDKDLSVHDFFNYRFGTEISDYLVNSLCIGITGGDSHKLSMKAMFPNLLKKEQTHGSIVKAMFQKEDLLKELATNDLVQKSVEEKWAVFSFHNGIETLATGISDSIRKNHRSIANLMSNTKVTSILFERDQIKVDVETFNKSQRLCVDHVFSAVPAFKLGHLLNESKLQKLLFSIPTVHMAVVCLQFNGEIIPKDFGFGFLVPSIENSPILGVTFDSCIFPKENSNMTQMTVMLGGYRFIELFGEPCSVDSEKLLQISKNALKMYLNIDTQPVNYHVAVHKNCIPQYTLGHNERISRIEQQIEKMNLSLVGASYHGFSVPDCILNAKIQVDQWIKSLI